MTRERIGWKERKFAGVKYLRWPDNPNSPIDQSMSKCECGEWWKEHRFNDGACPLMADLIGNEKR